ncbi:hypothetical protein RRG08_023404 [Elysia crispata]|uniref:DNA helicase Pif1-like 2B domain-containing protein n=1 Tax=Elysia crispata TaxID=231223 RepID=A0AAE1CXS5_9GAST|nr:hypothetical protein RRG08_023404 [Elysia crispata]
MDAVFPNFVNTFLESEGLIERASLAPLNETVSSVKKKLIEMVLVDSTTFISIEGTSTDAEAVHYPTEFLNSIEVAGLPPRKLNIKVGMPV